MHKFFRIVAGKKLYCDEKGVLIKDAEGYKEVAADDEKAEEFQGEEAGSVEEAAKMLATAAEKIAADSRTASAEAGVAASKAMEDLFGAIGEHARKAIGGLPSVKEVKASFDVEKVKAGLLSLKNHDRKEFTFEVANKAELDFLVKTTSETDSLTGDVLVPTRVPGIEREPVRTPFIEQIADVIDIDSEHLSYVEVVNESGAPLPTAELEEIPEKDFEFQEFKAPLKKVAVINRHSVELLQDAPQLVAAIKTMLQEDVNLVVDSQLLTGNGTGDQLPGVFGQASVLNQAAIGTKRVQDANLYDVIRVAITKIAVSGKGRFQATHVLLNPEDADELDLTKDANGQYILPPFRSADGTTIKGARVIENVGVAAGTFLVGDFRKLHVGRKGGIQIEFTNSHGDDFKHDILAVKVRRRLAAYVRSNDNGAFWTGNIDSVIGWLTAS